MMTRTSIFVGFVLLGFPALGEPGGHVQNSPIREAERVTACPPVVQELSKRFEKISKTDSPWKSIPSDSLRFGVTTGEGDAQKWFTIGFPQTELLKTKLKFERCAGTERTYQIIDPKNTLLLGAKLEGPGTNQVEMNLIHPKEWIKLFTLSQMELIEQAKVPAVFMNLDSLQKLPDGHGKRIFTSPDLLPFAMAHELFHLYQMKRFKKFIVWASDKNPEVLAKCKNNKEWMKAFEDELQDWRSVTRLGVKHADARPILLRIVERRRKSPKARICRLVGNGWSMASALKEPPNTLVRVSQNGPAFCLQRIHWLT